MQTPNDFITGVRVHKQARDVLVMPLPRSIQSDLSKVQERVERHLDN